LRSETGMFKKIILGLIIAPFIFTTAYAKEREGEITFKIKITAPKESRDVRMWIPYPVSDDEQTIEDVRIDGNFSYSGIYRQKRGGDLALYAEWSRPLKDRFLVFKFRAKAIERVKKDFPATESEVPVEIKEYLKGSEFIPTDGKVKEVALSIIKDKNGTLEKARAVYDWVVDNTFRDPNINGCGTGDVERILLEKGGKCADISSIFVALARASDVPAREVYGLRLGKKAEEDITGGHHCWSEFYLPDYGWVPVDPADVKKAMSTEKLDKNEIKRYRDYFFGAVDEYRIALSRGGKGYHLSPSQKDKSLSYFMYPYAEIDGKGVEWLAAQKELKYQISYYDNQQRVSHNDYNEGQK